MTSANSPLALSAEQLVLVAAARPNLTAEQTEKLRGLIRQDLDWDRLRDLASWHGMTPLLSRHLLDHCVDLLTRGKAEEFAARSAQHYRRTIFECAELVRILTGLQAAGILAVPFKGPVLSAQLYGEAGLREFADLDVLCRPEDATRADAVLTNAGYRAEVSLAEGHAKYYMRSECDRGYLNPDNGVHLELHWAITPPYFSFRLWAERLIERAGTIDLCGVAVKAFSAEDLLLVLCVNGTKEMWEKLEWVGAVSTLLAKEPGISWPRLDALVRQTGSQRILLIGLGLAQDIFDADIPREFSEAIGRDLTAQRLISEAKAW
ncbi:MAG: nucleotidyltransferase family protein, partial [Pyrinomonadaceae bacterium]